ncbi:MAG TPA: PAS-domain containing protein, partial [Micavibrio sp.]
MRTEKARLEAFLAAVPGEYCGWAPDGSLAYSEGFCRLLGVDHIHSLQDVQNCLSPSDAMALEGMYTRLQETGESFCMNVRTSDRSKTLKLCATRGRDLENSVTFHILWLEDITLAAGEIRRTEELRNHAEQELARMQAALDQVPVPLWMRNAHTDLVWCNRAYAAALDSSPASIVAEQNELPRTVKTPARSKNAASPQQKLPGRGLAQAALDSGQTETAQTHVVLAGARRLLQVREIPLPGLALTLGMAQDLTREEELETEQRRHGTANKELLEHLGSAIAIFNADQKIEFFNSSFTRLWQLEDRWLNTAPKLGDIMEKLRETRRLPEQSDFRRFKQSWLAMFTSLIAAHEEMLYLPDGQALRMLVIPHPLGGLMMTFEDVTSSLELESSYNTLIAVQKETIDHLDEGVAVFGGDGRLKLWNPSFARLWDLHPEDLEGEPHIT